MDETFREIQTTCVDTLEQMVSCFQPVVCVTAGIGRRRSEMAARQRTPALALDRA